MKIENLNKNTLITTSVLLLVLLYIYSINYTYSNAITVTLDELPRVESGSLVKLTGKVNIGNSTKNTTTICSSYCVYLNNYKGQNGLATVIGTIEKNNYTIIRVLKEYQ